MTRPAKKLEPWEEAIELCDEILDLVDELPERAEDFGAGVQKTTQGIRDWIEEHEHVTPNQQDALDSMKAKVDRWFE